MRAGHAPAAADAVSRRECVRRISLQSFSISPASFWKAADSACLRALSSASELDSAEVELGKSEAAAAELESKGLR